MKWVSDQKNCGKQKERCSCTVASKHTLSDSQHQCYTTENHTNDSTKACTIAPIPLSTFAGEPTSSVGKNFIRSYAGVCLQGVVIALSCIIFSAISSSPPAVDTGASVVTAVWTYVGELAFNLLVLVGAIKGCDRIVKEIMGL